MSSSAAAIGRHRKRRHRSRAARLFWAWLPAMIGVCVIMTESTEAFSSAHTSGPLHLLWEALFGPLPAERWEQIHHIIRKTGHFVGYGTLSLLFYYAWHRTSEILHRRTFRIENVVYALACTLVVASADEYHQTFLPGRTGRPQDVLLDMIGACTLQLLLWLVMLMVGLRGARAAARSV
jgi:VanZ family protein